MKRGAFVASAASWAAAPALASAANETDELFMQVANAAAQRLTICPKYIGYRVSGTLHAFRKDSPFERNVTVRTADEKAVVEDRVREPFPAPPNFDALSHWTFEMSFDEDDVDAYFFNVTPLKYRTEIDAHADAVVNAVKGYRLALLPDEGTNGHIALKRIDGKPHDASFRDLYFDRTTFLPTRVVYDGRDDFVLDVGYADAGGYWLVDSLRFGYTSFALGHLARASFGCSAAYANFTFSETSPDPRLA
ncbi:MAG: hypothetical protein JO359_14300 [Candidatus Eremiobacteraeota bacterium]|nr:hypothetical protein [Candidatus Eremiobacteraeota bacterium]